MIEPIKIDTPNIEGRSSLIQIANRSSTHNMTFGGAALAVTAADRLDINKRKTRAGSRVSVFRTGEVPNLVIRDHFGRMSTPDIRTTPGTGTRNIHTACVQLWSKRPISRKKLGKRKKNISRTIKV